MIMEAMLEGGWNSPEEEQKDKSTAEDTALTDSSENSLVASILNKGNDEQQMVQSALNSQSVSRRIAKYRQAFNVYLLMVGPKEFEVQKT